MSLIAIRRKLNGRNCGDVRDDKTAHRFEIGEGPDVVFADYRRSGGLLFIDHVEAPLHLRGRSAADPLMEGIVALAEAEGRSIVPLCAYADHWLRRRRQFEG